MHEQIIKLHIFFYFSFEPCGTEKNIDPETFGESFQKCVSFDCILELCKILLSRQRVVVIFLEKLSLKLSFEAAFLLP